VTVQAPCPVEAQSLAQGIFAGDILAPAIADFPQSGVFLQSGVMGEQAVLDLN
jgi:hypothetical protein